MPRSSRTVKVQAIDHEEGKSHGTTETMCRHVNAARRFFLNRLLAQMAEQYGHK